MRLSASDIDIILRSIRSVIADDGRIRVFGSRLDDNARGGDIDLMVEFDHPIDRPARLAARLTTQVMQAMQGRKIDIVLHAPNLLESEIHRIALEEGVLI